MLNAFRHRRALAAAAAALLLAAGLPASGHADSIGVKFNTMYNNTNLAPTDSAGAPGFAQTNYNTIEATTPMVALNNNSGAATTARLTISGSTNGFSYFYGNGAGPDEKLFDGNLYGPGPMTLSVANVPYSSYSLVVYTLSNAGGTISSISAGGATLYTSSPAPGGTGYIDQNAATPFVYTPITGTTAAAPTANGDYAVFTGLTGSTLTFTDSYISSGATNTFVEGFEIINTSMTAVPEPATWAASLLIGGALVLGVARRRSSRLG